MGLFSLQRKRIDGFSQNQEGITLKKGNHQQFQLFTDFNEPLFWTAVVFLVKICLDGIVTGISAFKHSDQEGMAIYLSSQEGVCKENQRQLVVESLYCAMNN